MNYQMNTIFLWLFLSRKFQPACRKAAESTSAMANPCMYSPCELSCSLEKGLLPYFIKNTEDKVKARPYKAYYGNIYSFGSIL